METRSRARRCILLAGLLVLTVVFGASCAKQSATKSAENTVDCLAKGDFAAVTANFDEVMQSQMPADKLGQLWTQLTAQIGPFKSRQGTREAQEQGYNVAYVTCQFEKSKIDIKLVYNDKGQVSGLFIVPSQPASPGK